MYCATLQVDGAVDGGVGEHNDGNEEGEGSAEKAVEETPHAINTGNRGKRVRGRN